MPRPSRHGPALFGPPVAARVGDGRAIYVPLTSLQLNSTMPSGWIYMMTHRPFGTLYVGVTNDTVRPAGEHRQGTGSSFTSRYGLTRLVYIEITRQYVTPSIARPD